MTILIVDDNEPNLYQLQVLLGGNGYQIVTAVNGAEALSKARQNPPDLIVSDILMPVMDGFTLCREWKKDERLRQIPFVFYTATYTDERDREFALSLGAERFLVKPEEPEVFIRTIREVIQQVQRPPAPPAANTPARLPVEEPPKEEFVYLKQYNEVLVRKLEAKMQQLEQANRELERDITERKRTEEALRESEQLYRSVVSSVAEGIVLQDRAGRTVASNRSAERILGRTAEELKGQIAPDPSLQAIHEDGSPLPGENLPHMITLRTGKSQSNVCMGIPRPDGTLAWILANSEPIFHVGDSAPYAVVTSFVDITERKRAEATLIGEKYLLYTLMDNVPDLIYFKDRESHFTRINLALAQKLDLNHPAQATGKTDFDFFAAKRAKEFYNDEEKIIRTGQPMVGKEEMVAWPDGKVTWNSTTKMPLRDTHGNIVGTFGVSRDITERKLAEADNARLAAIVNSSDDAIFSTTREGFIETWNAGAERMYGYAAEEIKGKHFSTFIPEDRRADLAGMAERLLRGEALVHFEHEDMRKDGSRLQVSRTLSPIKDDTGFVTGVSVISRDIAERKRAEEMLQEYERVVEGSDERIAVIDREYRYLLANRAFLGHVGLERGDVIGSSVPEVLGEEFFSRVVKPKLDECLQGNVVQFEAKSQHPKPRQRDILASYFPIEGEHGVDRVACVLQDITERKRAEKALRESEERFRQVAESAGDWIWEVDTQGLYVYASPVVERILGYKPEELVGKVHFFDLMAPETRDQSQAAASEVFSYKKRLDTLVKSVVRKDGTMAIMEATGVPVLDEAGNLMGYRGVNKDITQRKLAEAQLAGERDLLHALMDNIPDKIYFKDTENRFVRINRAHAESLGLKDPAEAVGKTDFDVHSPERAREAYQDEKKILDTGEPLIGKIEKISESDGKVRWNLVTKVPLKNNQGQVVGLVGTSRDITERMQVQEALQVSERQLAQAMDLALLAHWEFNPATGIFTFNDRFYALYGTTAEREGGYQMSAEAYAREFLYPEDVHIVADEIAKSLATPDPDASWALEHRVRRRDGEMRHIVVRISVIKNSEGQTIKTRGVNQDVTQHRRAEEALRENEEKYRSLVRNIPDVVWTMNAENRFTFISKNIEKLSGFTVGEVYQQGINPYLASLHPDDVSKVAEGIRALFAKGRPFDVEVRVKRKDGEWKWIHDRALATYEKNGIRYADGLLSDITARKRAEEAMRESEEKYRVLYESSRDPIMLLTPPEWKFTAVNPAAIALFEARDEREFVSVDPWGLSPEYQPDGTLSSVKAHQMIDLAMERRSHLFDWTHKKFSGEEFFATVMLTRMVYRGQPFLQATIRDITERKRAEAEHIRLVTAIEQSAEAVLITNTNGDIEYVNPAFTRITGYSREEVLGQNPRILKSGKQDAEFYQQLWATILNGQTWHGELINRRKDGSLYTEHMSVTPVRSEHGEITNFIATKLDVTARKQLEQQFLQVQKMEAVGRLAGGVAHDFNNLLTIINGYAALLSKQTPTEDPRRAQLNQIQMAGERAASVTRQLLAFSRRQLLEPRVLDLNSVLADVEKMLRHLIGEDVELVTTLKPDLGRVKADPGQIEQVIMNLAVNARDAMPEGGKLLIETGNVEIDEKYARRHSPMIPGKYVMVAVSDTGGGMSLETQAHIFEPFFTTKEEGRGTGLGLATVYGIVKQSGGFIWVYSEPGQGSTFKVYFPRVEEVLPAAEPSKVRPKLAKGSETVLVVEDEEGVRSLVCQTLASHGYKVLEATGAAQTLKISKKHTEPIHLLLTDVVMPQTSGKELVKRLSTLHPETKVLYMSGYTDDAIVRHGILEGGMPFLQKPFAPNALLLKVREVLKMKSKARH